jgi:hypothetical protein
MMLSQCSTWFGDYLHPIYTNELEVMDTADTQRSASYVDFHNEIDKGWK